MEIETYQFNQSFIDKTEVAVIVTVITMIVLGVLLDVLIWRRRYFAKYIIYFELALALVYGLVPFNNYD